MGHNKKYNRPPYVHDSRFIILLLPIDVHKIAPAALALLPSNTYVRARRFISLRTVRICQHFVACKLTIKPDD